MKMSSSPLAGLHWDHFSLYLFLWQRLFWEGPDCAWASRAQRKDITIKEKKDMYMYIMDQYNLSLFECDENKIWFLCVLLHACVRLCVIKWKEPSQHFLQVYCGCAALIACDSHSHAYDRDNGHILPATDLSYCDKKFSVRPTFAGNQRLKRFILRTAIWAVTNQRNQVLRKEYMGKVFKMDWGWNSA